MTSREEWLKAILERLQQEQSPLPQLLAQYHAEVGCAGPMNLVVHATSSGATEADKAAFDTAMTEVETCRYILPTLRD